MSEKNINKKEDEMDSLLEKADLTALIEEGTVIETSKLRGRRKKKEKLDVVSVRISNELLEKLLQAGEMRGLGYQPMIRQILMEQIENYLQKGV